MALNNNKVRNIKKGDAHHQSKLTEKDRVNIKDMYSNLLDERNGKSKGIATIIQKKYPQISITRICQIIKE